VRTIRFPALLSFWLIVLIIDENESLLVGMSNPSELGIFRMKLSIDLSGMLGNNFTEFPQKTAAFWGSNSPILDLANDISF
jgi:hypothetical protein